MVVVARPSLWLAGMLTMELADTRMLSAPRTKRARPFGPVRTVSPARMIAVFVSATGCASVELNQTSPDALLTCQLESCAIVADPAQSMTAIASNRELHAALVLVNILCLLSTRV